MASKADGGEMEGTYAMQMTRGKMHSEEMLYSHGENDKKEPPPKKVRVKSLEGKDTVARKITIGGIGITCALEHCGHESPAAFTEGGIVYINMDHPLYRRQYEKGKDMLGFYLTYLLSQQVALLLVEGDTHRAFEMQDRLLTDSW